MPMFRRYMRVVVSAVIAAVALMLTGCASGGDGGAASLLLMSVKLDKSSYFLGEMVVCTVELTNISDKPQEAVLLRMPYSSEYPRDSNLHFRVRSVSSWDVYRCPPIVVKHLSSPYTVKVKPWEKVTTNFGFVNLTEAPGRYKLLIEYAGIPMRETDFLAEERVPTLPLNDVLDLKVKKERLFSRDSCGLLVEEQAIWVAREKYGRSIAGARAQLVETDSDLLDWWVTLDKAPADIREGEPACVAYYVSPYGGFVRGPASPMVGDVDELRRERADGGVSGP